MKNNNNSYRIYEKGKKNVHTERMWGNKKWNINGGIFELGEMKGL